MTRDPSSTQSLARSPYAGFGWRAASSAVLGHLPRPLISEARAASLQDFAERLPMSWYWGMFETRLSSGDERVDLLGALVQNSDTRRQLNSGTLDGSILSFSKGTLGAWAKNDGSLFARSPNFWFEWDQDRPDAPGLNWLCLAPEFFDKSAKPLSSEDVVELAEHFLSSDPALHVEGATNTLSRLVSSLPEGARLMSFSSLKPRGRAACRVFARLPRGRLGSWLRSIDWPGDHRGLDDVLPLFDVEGEQQWCQIEFDGAVGPYLALELAQTERGFPHRGAREFWLDQAVSRGWATREKADAVLKWHGASPADLPGHPDVKLLRSFHLKLALSPGRAPEAKAYLGFYFRKPKVTLVA